MIENKRYDVIYEKEPRGQVVTDDGIPCTARTCCTRLNRLEEENKKQKDFINQLQEELVFFKTANVNVIQRLEEENKELKKENTQYKLLLTSLKETARKLCEVPKRWNE